jgi:NTE family protein
LSEDPKSKDDGRPKVGLVLSGGGARGAYEVGVLRYVREMLPGPAHFHCITGSSVGAINGAYIAATCDRPRAQVRLLSRVWNEMRLDEVYRFGWDQMRSLPQVLFGKNLPKSSTHGSTIGGLVDSRFLESVVRDRIPWRGIAQNLHQGNLGAFACSATEVTSGTTTVFVQTRESDLPKWPKAPGQVVVQTAVTAAHALASAAIPVLFPAVRVGSDLFVDGSLRQNTPIRPAMHLGADRILVVGLRHESEGQGGTAPGSMSKEEVYPNAIFMLGKMLNALMLDKLEADLARIRRTNELIEAGIQLYGDDFPAKIAQQIRGRNARPYRRIEISLVRPSKDLGSIAMDIVHRTGLKKYGGVMARWLRRISTQTDDVSEGDLASYVMFDPQYVQALIELGWNDAKDHHDELCNLFDL